MKAQVALRFYAKVVSSDEASMKVILGFGHSKANYEIFYEISNWFHRLISFG